MRTVILNTAILTTHGTFSYTPASLGQILNILQASEQTGIPILSAVGHQATADILTELLHHPVPVNRIEYRQEPGDVAIVFKLRGRAPEGKILSRDEVEAIGYDFGLIRMVS